LINLTQFPVFVNASGQPSIFVNVRVSAARALGRIGDPAALPALAEALSDSEVTKINAPTTVEDEARKAIQTISTGRR